MKLTNAEHQAKYRKAGKSAREIAEQSLFVIGHDSQVYCVTHSRLTGEFGLALVENPRALAIAAAIIGAQADEMGAAQEAGGMKANQSIEAPSKSTVEAA